MAAIHLIRKLGSDDSGEQENDIAVREIFNGPFRRLVEVRLRNGAVLSRHKADVPITVQCISGSGTFNAGRDLEESLALNSGSLITLEAGIEHEVIADPQLHILVSKFKSS